MKLTISGVTQEKVNKFTLSGLTNKKRVLTRFTNKLKSDVAIAIRTKRNLPKRKLRWPNLRTNQM
jgi:hypothetical protein